MRANLDLVVDRVIATLDLFSTKKAVTIPDLQARLECCHTTAWRYIQAVSLHKPIMEEQRAYHEPIIYRMMEE